MRSIFSFKPHFTAALLAALSVIALYAGLGLGGDFLLDDGINILQNRLLYVEQSGLDEFIHAALSFHDGNGSRSLPMLSFAVDYWRAGSMDAATFKLTNVLIHGCTVFFLAFMLNRLLQLAGWSEHSAWKAAVLLALAWGLHPLQVSSVLYVVQRMQTLASMFLILALWAYLGMRLAQMNGQRGRIQGALCVFFWLLALLCKEDAVLLVAYTFVLELTVLRFRAGLPVVSRGLKQSYTLMVGLALLAYIFIVIPHFWKWESHYSREFSTPERLLTQGRVLVLYLSQILTAWPNLLIFHYDSYPISYSLWRPWTTLPALGLLLVLLGWAWRWRCRQPLFACGVLFFFAGHFVTSNVIALELVFEHRNHLPLLGVLIAVAGLLHGCAQHWRLSHRSLSVLSISALIVLILACSTQLHTWGHPERHAKKITALNPTSSRAWSQYSGVYFKQYNQTKNLAFLEQSIATLEQGLTHTDSPTLAANLITNKSILGTVSSQDWQTYLQLLESAPPARVHTISVQLLMSNAENGYITDTAPVLQAIEVLNSKPNVQHIEPLKAALFAYKMEHKEAARIWFVRFAQQEKVESKKLLNVAKQLEQAGYPEWSDEMQAASKNKQHH